jgi:2-iminobutanoate/2-iminopropanoate deaminase
MLRQFIRGDFESTRSYSRAVEVVGGKTVYLAGVGAPVDVQGNSLAGDFRAQAHGCFAALKRNLEAVGGKLSDIVTMTVSITDSRYGADFVNVRKEYYPDGNFPGSALIGVASLARPEMMVEVQAIAVIDSAQEVESRR